MATKPKSAKPGKKVVPVEVVPPPPSWWVTAYITANGIIQEYDLSAGAEVWFGLFYDCNGPDYVLKPGDLAELRADHIETDETAALALTPAAFNVFMESEPDYIYSDIQNGIPMETAVRRAIDSFEFAFGFCPHKGCDGYFYERGSSSVFDGFLGCPSCTAPADAPILVGHMFGLNDASPADFFELSDDEQQVLRDRLTLEHPPLARDQKVDEDAIEDAKEAAAAAAEAARAAVTLDTQAPAQAQAPKQSFENPATLAASTPVTPAPVTPAPAAPARRPSAFGLLAPELTTRPKLSPKQRQMVPIPVWGTKPK